MENKHLSKGFLVILITSIIFIVAGIVLLIVGSGIIEPSMGSADWFETSSKRTGLIFFGIFLLGAGIIFLIYFFIGRHTAKKAKEYQETAQIEYLENSNPEKKEYCEYCGTLLNDKGICESCGAKLKKRT